MKRKISFIAAVIVFTFFLQKGYAKNGGDFYQITIYKCKNDTQVQQVDEYLKTAWIPALHRAGIKNIGVFKPLSDDTAQTKLVYVLTPFHSQDEWMNLDKLLSRDQAYQAAAEFFLNARAHEPPYERAESILLTAFEGQPHLLLPKSKDTTRVFELRSYESPTAELLNKKIAMFNNDEIKIFNRLGFNPVFYGRVVSGSHMPNLMYMPVFTDRIERNEQWKVFSFDPKWKEISADPKNENNVSVSHIDSILMQSTGYSDY
ncbi:MAG TPA: NIPSNAP family protein [Chitinophagaceae bacterium]|nr:NIPSNAP family protein [Chitinophagaceae bacterium]